MRERLNRGEILVADGAMGTMLFQKGLAPGDCPESYNLSRPEILEDIARQYLAAGAEIIQTNTFGASRLKLTQYYLEEKLEEIIRSAVYCVRKAVGDKAYISASCGPSGEMLLPYGTISEEAMFENFREQMAAFSKAGVDVICIETMTDLNEAVLAIRAAKAAMPATPLMATMTFDKIPRGYFTVMGVSIEKAVEGLTHAGADIVGSNCGHGIDKMIDIASQIRALTDKPILIQSNAGLPLQENGQLVYPESPAYFSDRIEALIEAGANIIGGCCGTTPDHVRAIRTVVDSYCVKTKK
jgi:5-methyltetrahydrofolate--homocysteine methyltransferase